MLTAGIVFKNEFYFGTETGLYKIKDGQSVMVLLKDGINCLLKDRFQDLIWIGTSGEGLFTLSYDQYTIKSSLLRDFCPSVSKSITAICPNDDKTLWLGTDGSGIITIPGFNAENEITGTQLITTGNGLYDNTIYSLEKSKYGIWIGCKSGLAFYSNKDKTIHKITNSIHTIYAICELDSILWIACYERGMVKVSLAFKNELPELSDIRLYSLNNGDEASNRFLSIKKQDNQLFFVNKGSGVFEFTGNGIKPVFENLNSINQIEPIDNSGFMISTDFGTYLFTGDNANQLNYTTTKDIVHGSWKDYWLSSDNGLALYNTGLGTFQYFDTGYGLTVTEYCNGSSYRDKPTSTLFFGGINGFTTVKYNDYDEAMDYIPTLFLEKLRVFGIDKNIKDFEQAGNLVFKSNENFLSVTFNALDYINGYNYNYYYKIGENGQWVDNGNSGTVSFTDITSGTYTLYVKYYNKMLDKESYAKSIVIIVLPPWYFSPYAYIMYLLVAILIVYLTYLTMSKRKLKQLEEEAIKAGQRRKEELYEAKLDFFTDMAHEFCTPLTLISGPCNLIMEQKNVSPSVTRYAGIIDRNVKRLNSLIDDLMSFKQMESGYKQPVIRRLNVSDMADRIIDAFQINTSGTGIVIKKQYFAGINWNSDEGFLTTILINLISNAIKYSNGGPAEVEIQVVEDNLKIKVTNKGKGISEAEASTIFDKFTVLDNRKHDDWKQTGLGLAITASMVKLLDGEIGVESIPDDSTSFIVNLPFLQAEYADNRNNHLFRGVVIPQFVLPQTKYEYKEERKTVAIIDDDPEMLWFICDVLTPDFNVLPVNDSKTAKDILSANHTDIILCDVMMDEIDGIKLAEMLKSNKTTSHIPLIIVSAAHDTKVQTQAINAGAELYITKPFDNLYLKSAINRLLGRKEDLKDYFSSPMSAYELTMGKLQHSEHRRFLKKLYSIINKNITNENLSPDFIASELGTSTRSLYRKVKEATDKTLHEIISDGKLTVAENLLLKSKFTIDEIVFKSGYTNRASFYRAFSNKYGCNPTEYIEKNKT